MTFAPRSLAGNPDSPQAVIFLTSIIDEIVGVASDYVDHHAISDWNTSALRSAKPGQWLSGQTSRLYEDAIGLDCRGFQSLPKLSPDANAASTV